MCIFHFVCFLNHVLLRSSFFNSRLAAGVQLFLPFVDYLTRCMVECQDDHMLVEVIGTLANLTIENVRATERSNRPVVRLSQPHSLCFCLVRL